MITDCARVYLLRTVCKPKPWSKIFYDIGDDNLPGDVDDSGGLADQEKVHRVAINILNNFCFVLFLPETASLGLCW